MRAPALLIALLAVPALAAEPTFRPKGATALVGPAFFTGEAPTAMRAHIEGTLEWRPLREGELGLDFALPIGIGFMGEDVEALGVRTSTSSFWFDVVPAVRAHYILAAALTAYGHAGLGLGAYRTSIDMRFRGGSHDAGFLGLLRFAAGVAIALNEQFSFRVEPLSLDIHMGPGWGASFSVLFGATYAL